MKEYNKSSKLEHVAYDIRGPVLEEAMRMRANGEKFYVWIQGILLNLALQLQMKLSMIWSWMRVIVKAIQTQKGFFSPQGYHAVLPVEKIPNVDIDDIYLGNGVSELIVMSMQGLLDNGDEVLVPMPDYPLWTAAVSLASGNAVHYLCDEEANWYPDIEDIKSKITSNTKAIVVINPNNPTGALYPDEILLEIVEIARQNNLIIFADEIYDRLVMDGENTRLSQA